MLNHSQLLVILGFLQKSIRQIALIAFITILMGKGLYSQSLGLNNSAPNAAAIIDATSTTQGILIPRMTSAQRDAISSPPTGLLVFVTDKTTGFHYYDGTKWVNMYSPSSCIVKRKTTDESVCGTGGGCSQNVGTTLQDDDELVIPLQANQAYAIEGFLFLIANGATPDLKIGFTLPAGATMIIGYHANFSDNNTNIATDILTASSASSNRIPSAGAKENPVFVAGSVVMGNTAGNLKLQWAQFQNSDPTSVTVRASSYLKATLVQ
jgi:hypothetical protein